MDRINEFSLYQAGGDPKSPSSPRSPKKNNSSYNPADINGKSASDLDKFRKANRELKRDLQKALHELKLEKEKTKELQKQLDGNKLNLI